MIPLVVPVVLVEPVNAVPDLLMVPLSKWQYYLLLLDGILDEVHKISAVKMTNMDELVAIDYLFIPAVSTLSIMICHWVPKLA